MGEESDQDSSLTANINVNSESLDLKIVRKVQNLTIFETETAQKYENFFGMSDENNFFNQISMKKTVHEAIFGLGERRTDFRLRNGIYTIFPLEDRIQYDTGIPDEGRNLYGHHPFFVKVKYMNVTF